MAPIMPVIRTLSEQHFQPALPSLESRGLSDSDGTTPLASIFAVLDRSTSTITSRAIQIISEASEKLPRRTVSFPLLSIPKRQNILAIPTTYAGLNDGPSPGAVVGIVLGSVAGFLFALWFVYAVLQLSGRFGSSTTIIEEEVIRRRSRSPRRSRSRSETIEIRSEHRSPEPPRRVSRREEIIVEERISHPPEDDIVEVIEEHSPERQPSRRESKRMSGFRTVDPAEFGGGDRPMRKVSRR